MMAFFIIWGVITLCIIAILFSAINKYRNKSAEVSGLENRINDLNKSITALIRDSGIDVYMYDENEKELYKFIDGDYKPAGFELEDIEKKIHPDDLDHYNKEYSDVINNVRDTVISTLRIYNSETKTFDTFEHIISPIKRNAQGIVTRYLYTKRNITQCKEDDLKQKSAMLDLHLALKSGNMMKWKYNINSRTNILTDANEQEILFTEADYFSLFKPEDYDVFMEFIQNMTENHTSEFTVNFNIKLPETDEFTNFTATGVSWVEEDNEIYILGVWKNMDEFNKLNQELLLLQSRVANYDEDEPLLRKCD